MCHLTYRPDSELSHIMLTFALPIERRNCLLEGNLGTGRSYITSSRSFKPLGKFHMIPHVKLCAIASEKIKYVSMYHVGIVISFICGFSCFKIFDMVRFHLKFNFSNFAHVLTM